MGEAGVRAELLAGAQQIGCQRNLGLAERIKGMTGIRTGKVCSQAHIPIPE